MIKINLLGAPKLKRGKRAGAAVETGGGGGEGMNPLILLLIIVAVVGAGLFYVYNQEDQRATRIASDIRKADDENHKLSEVKATYERKQKEAENYKRRVDVIDQLRAGQSGPVNLLTMLGDTVNTTEAVWLTKMSDDGASVKLEGTALNVHAVANLMANLKKTGYFKNVEISETSEDSNKDYQSFSFSLTCEKQGAAPAGQKS
jgi:type IV pilus assembly protein PilN